MKRFLLKIGLLLTLFVIFDICFGYVMKNAQNQIKGGTVKKMDYIFNQMNSEIVIMGSSRALNDYNPSIITEITGLSCYNCGYDGNGIIMSYGLWKEFSKRYIPKVIIYDLYPGYDLLPMEDNHRFIYALKPFYEKSADIDSIFWIVDKRERFKMLLSSYKYNTKFLGILAGRFQSDNSPNGFDPEFGIINNGNKDRIIFDGMSPIYDDTRYYYLKKFIDECSRENVRLIFTVSPFYSKMNQEVLAPFLEECSDKKIPVWNYSKALCGIDSLFNDNIHLNSVGAEVFSKNIAHKLKTEIFMKKCIKM